MQLPPLGEKTGVAAVGLPEKVALATSDSLNTYDVLRPDKLLFTKSAFEKVSDRLTQE